LLIDTVVCLTLAKWETVSGRFGGYLIHHPVKLIQRPFVEWFSQGEWHEGAIPTRPEYLIRRGGKIAMRNIRAILELQPPYLAVVKL
jgi:hypothetical protein